MYDIIAELTANLFQSFMFIGFLFAFFCKNRKSSKKDKTIFLIFVAASFGFFSFFTFYGGYIVVNQALLYLVLLELYTLPFLKGNLFGRIFMPILTVLVNAVISFLFSYSISFFTGHTYLELATQPSIYRYICMIIINITNLLVLFVMVALKNKIKIIKISDIISFLIIPLITLCVIYSTLYIMILTNYENDILSLSIVVCICMLAITVIIWYLVIRISKDNEIRTELLLMEQRADLYESNILQSNNQIEKISQIKHDMLNKLLCIGRLISDKLYNEAELMCNACTEELSGVYTPVNTNNPLLNAVVNVEQEKALAYDIEFKITISDNLSDFSKNTDIVSVIGNLCDNAIEYLKDTNPENRKMNLDIKLRNNSYIISCTNNLKSSVFTENPELKTSKKDKSSHGKGIGILNSLAQKYNGETRFYEKNGLFYAVVVLNKSYKLKI